MLSSILVKGTVLLGVVALWSPAIDRSPTKLETEIAKVQKAASRMPADDPVWQNVKAEIGNELSDAQAAIGAGFDYLAVEELEKAKETLQAVKYMDDQKQTVGQSLAAFNEEWGRVHTDVASYKKKAGTLLWARKPVVLRALGESSAGKAQPLLQGARAFSKVTDIASSLYYVGEAKGATEVAGFCYSLDLPVHGAPLALRSIAKELDELQARVNAAFQPPRSIEKHPQFIRLNASLKYAKELDAAHLYAGALYQYLDGLQQARAIELPDVDASAKAQLRSSVAVAQKQFKDSGRDDSIAELFLQKAQFLLTPKQGMEPTAENWKIVDSIVREVLPTYLLFVSGTTPASTSTAKGSTRVTLVRWPYT
jgi:hypothetical protein